MKEIAISIGLLNNVLDEMLENIAEQPQLADYWQSKAVVEIRQQIALNVRNALVTMVVNLYGGCELALKRDIARIALSGARKDADPHERTELLLCLIGSLQFYFQNDYSTLVDMIQEELDRRERDGEGIEDVEWPYI